MGFASNSAFLRFHLLYYGQTAVIVFFVLSGYVIAHVIATRERTLQEYAASRFGRLYSVVLPALILTAICDYLGAMRDPGLYTAGGDAVVLRYMATSVFLNQFWLWPQLEPTYAPTFWTLSVELSYYVAIALFVFARGYVRLISLVLLSVLTGPTIVLLAPIWFLGYGTYHFSQHRRMRIDVAIAIWLISALSLLSCYLIEVHVSGTLAFLRIPHPTLGGLLADYAGGIFFAINLIAFNAFSDRAEPFLMHFAGIIRWLGSMTFALYLFHYPLMYFFSAYSVGERSSFAQTTWLMAGTFLVVATLGHLCEQSKGAYKKWFLSMWGRVAAVTI